jgi:hypothetical protein
VVVCLGAGALGCGDDAPESDAGLDAAVDLADATTPDGEPGDGPGADAAPSDGGPADDAGPADGGSPDAAPADAAPADAAPADAPSSTDAMAVADASDAPDSASDTDAGGAADAGCTAVNACGGCAVLTDDPGDPCGTCGVFACAGMDSVTCSGDHPLNACGGCATLSGAPDTACTCGGAGQDRWACSGVDLLVCEDRNTLPSSATIVPQSAPAAGGMMVSITDGVTDSATDVDWYRMSAIDSGDVDPTLTLDSSVPSITYRACVFYDTTAALTLTPYNCTNDENTCVWYDASSNTIQNLSAVGDQDQCIASPAGFDLATDLYGCCDDTAAAGNVYSTHMFGFDDSGDISGHTYVYVEVLTNPTGVCDVFSALTVAF